MRSGARHAGLSAGVKYITPTVHPGRHSTRRTEEGRRRRGREVRHRTLVIGGALAVSEVAKPKKVVHLFSGTRGHLGQPLPRYSFQWAASPIPGEDVVRQLHEGESKRSLAPAGPDYAFGWSVEKYVKEVGKTHGNRVRRADRHLVGRTRFSNYAEGGGKSPTCVPSLNSRRAVGGAYSFQRVVSVATMAIELVLHRAFACSSRRS